MRFARDFCRFDALYMLPQIMMEIVYLSKVNTMLLKKPFT